MLSSPKLLQIKGLRAEVAPRVFECALSSKDVCLQGMDSETVIFVRACSHSAASYEIEVPSMACASGVSHQNLSFLSLLQ